MEQSESHLSAPVLQSLREAAGWARFLAILGFIGMGMMVLVGVISGIAFLFAGTEGALADEMMPFNPILFSLLYLVIGAIYYLPIKYLYNFSARAREISATQSQEVLLRGAMDALRSHYKFIGIYTIAVFGLYLLVGIGAAVYFALKS